MPHNEGRSVGEIISSLLSPHCKVDFFTEASTSTLVPAHFFVKEIEMDHNCRSKEACAVTFKPAKSPKGDIAFAERHIHDESYRHFILNPLVSYLLLFRFFASGILRMLVLSDVLSTLTIVLGEG